MAGRESVTAAGASDEGPKGIEGRAMTTRGFLSWERRAARGPGGAKSRALGVLLAAAIVAGACGTAASTATPTAGPTHSPSPTGWPTWAPPSGQSPTNTPSPTLAPSPSDTASPTGTQAPGAFAVAMGLAPLATPAADLGAAAGTEINDFGFDLLRRLDPKGNLCASPASIALALAMVRAGAIGTTAAQMDKVLHGFGASGQAGEIAALIATLNSQTSYDDSGSYPIEPQATPDHTGQDPLIELDVSNAVFSQQGMNLEQAYLDALSSSFGAGVGLLDFMNDPEAARLIINQWASDRTHGRIPNILPPGEVTSSWRIAVANAIYLKAGWTSPFDPAQTRSKAFTRADGSTVSVPTMAEESWLQYSAGTGYRAVDLPMGGSFGSLSMTIVVPDDMSSFVNGLTAAKLAAIEKQGNLRDVDLTLPRFSTDSPFDLSNILKAMGMPAAFDPTAADFSGITTDQQLFIGAVIHEANIDVVEQGTTAAAVTVVGMATMGGGPGPTAPHVQFHVNKPFLYFVRDRTTGAVLFMGRVADPSAKS